MKSIIIITALCFLVSCGSSERQDKYEQVGETAMYIIPPPGFLVDQETHGFRHITIREANLFGVELPGAFAEGISNFSEEALKKKYAHLYFREETTVGEYQALYFKFDHAKDDQTFTKYILVFGNDMVSYMLNTVYLKDYPPDDDEVRAALFSVELR
jgi:hypothetical protein